MLRQLGRDVPDAHRVIRGAGDEGALGQELGYLLPQVAGKPRGAGLAGVALHSPDTRRVVKVRVGLADLYGKQSR